MGVTKMTFDSEPEMKKIHSIFPEATPMFRFAITQLNVH